MKCAARVSVTRPLFRPHFIDTIDCPRQDAPVPRAARFNQPTPLFVSARRPGSDGKRAMLFPMISRTPSVSVATTGVPAIIPRGSSPTLRWEGENIIGRGRTCRRPSTLHPKDAVLKPEHFREPLYLPVTAVQELSLPAITNLSRNRLTISSAARKSLAAFEHLEFPEGDQAGVSLV